MIYDVAGSRLTLMAAGTRINGAIAFVASAFSCIKYRSNCRPDCLLTFALVQMWRRVNRLSNRHANLGAAGAAQPAQAQARTSNGRKFNMYPRKALDLMSEIRLIGFDATPSKWMGQFMGLSSATYHPAVYGSLYEIWTWIYKWRQVCMCRTSINYVPWPN